MRAEADINSAAASPSSRQRAKRRRPEAANRPSSIPRESSSPEAGGGKRIHGGPLPRSNLSIMPTETALHPRRRGVWTSAEDKRLSHVVSSIGASNWSRVAELVPGRTSKSCRLRWCNQLRPTINKGPYSEWEEAVLVVAQTTQGNKWADIARLLDGRTDNNVKNQWNCAIRPRLKATWKSNPFLSANPRVTVAELLQQKAEPKPSATPATEHRMDRELPADEETHQSCSTGGQSQQTSDPSGSANSPAATNFAGDHTLVHKLPARRGPDLKESRPLAMNGPGESLTPCSARKVKRVYGQTHKQGSPMSALDAADRLVMSSSVPSHAGGWRDRLGLTGLGRQDDGGRTYHDRMESLLDDMHGHMGYRYRHHDIQQQPYRQRYHHEPRGRGYRSFGSSAHQRLQMMGAGMGMWQAPLDQGDCSPWDLSVPWGQ